MHRLRGPCPRVQSGVALDLDIDLTLQQACQYCCLLTTGAGFIYTHSLTLLHRPGCRGRVVHRSIDKNSDIDERLIDVTALFSFAFTALTKSSSI